MAEETKTKVVKEDILVNEAKRKRALDIIALVTGKKDPQHSTDVERKEKWAIIFADEKVKPEDKAAVMFVYKKLGGLVRTHEEHQEVLKKAAAKKKVAKKK